MKTSLTTDKSFSKKVLLLDDDGTTLAILSHHLRNHGMEVTACREIEAAEAILDHAAMDAVVTDLCVSALGGLEGTRLIRHMATHFPETDLLVVSSHSSEEIRELALTFGAATFYEKPVDGALIADRLLKGRGIPASAGEGLIHAVESLDEFLAADSIFSVLQPIVSLQEGAGAPPIHALECLARGPQDSVLRNPEILFEYAARKELLYETDLICIRAGLAEARALGRGHRIFLNVQPRSMTNPEFPAQVSRLVEEAGFNPGDIVFELVEQQTILNPRAFANAVAQVRQFGFRVALDDFGVGFCNLHLLLDLRPDYVKLPRYFTQGICGDANRQEVVRSIRSLVATLGSPVIMEGIETPEELETVRQLGVEYGQGYYFARPMRAERLLETPAFAAHQSRIIAALPIR
jgi:EAL domain-containing protein (putative c-di-GMP-specific phosphodiesterase class I)